MNAKLAIFIAGFGTQALAGNIEKAQQLDFNPFSIDRIEMLPTKVTAATRQDFRSKVSQSKKLKIGPPRVLFDFINHGQGIYLEAEPTMIPLGSTMVDCSTAKARYNSATEYSTQISEYFDRINIAYEEFDANKISLQDLLNRLNEINVPLNELIADFNDQNVAELSSYDRIVEYRWEAPASLLKVVSVRFKPNEIRVPSAPGWNPVRTGGDVEIPGGVEGYPKSIGRSVVFQQYMSPLTVCLSPYGMAAAGELEIVTREEMPQLAVCNPGTPIDKGELLDVKQKNPRDQDFQKVQAGIGTQRGGCVKPPPVFGEIKRSYDVNLRAFVDPDAPLFVIDEPRPSPPISDPPIDILPQRPWEIER